MAWLGGARWRVGLVVALAFGASGCAASNYINAAEQTRPKNEQAAVEYLALALKADPTNEKALAMLKDLGQKIAEEHAAKVAELERAGRFADAVAQCDRVIATRKLITDLPGGVDIFHDADERARLAKKASAKYLADGKALAASGSHKKAATAFCLAKGFDPSNTEAVALYKQEKNQATLHVAVPTFTGDTSHARAIAQGVTQRFFDKMVEKKPQFLALEHAGDGQAQATLHGTIMAKYGDTKWRDHRGTNSERKTRPAVDENGNPKLDPQGNQMSEEYTAHASWIVHERETSAEVSIGYEVRLADGTVKWSARKTKSNADHKKFVSHIEGDPDVVPSEVNDLPHSAVEPLNFEGLTHGLIDQEVEELTNELFVQQKK